MNIVERIENEYSIYDKHHRHPFVIYTHFIDTLLKCYIIYTILTGTFQIIKLLIVIILINLINLSHKIDDTYNEANKRLIDNYKIKNIFLIERSIFLRWFIYPCTRLYKHLFSRIY